MPRKRTIKRVSSDKTKEFWFDEDEASRAVEFCSKFLTHVKGEWAGSPLELASWESKFIRELFGWKRTSDNSRKYRKALLFIARKNGKTTLGAAIALYLLFADREPGAEIYCLDPSVRTLCGDFSWRAVGDLHEGDAIIAYDEWPSQPRTYRKLRSAIVTSVARIMQPCCLISMEDGRSIISSIEHKWMSGDQREDIRTWVKTGLLRPGSSIRNLGMPWEEDRSREAGYLAGIFDGEGCFHQTVSKRKDRNGGGSGFRIAFSQKPGIVMDLTRSLCEAKGFNISAPRTHKSGVDTFEIAGFYNCARFLGQIRPKRLIEKGLEWVDGRTPNRRLLNEDGQRNASIRSIEYIGTREVVAIGTSTHTLFAEGLFSHNSVAADRDQAAIMYETARGMVENSPELNRRCEIYRRAIVVPSTASAYHVLSADAPTKHGKNSHAVLFDELHAQPNRELYDVMKTSMGSRRQPLFLMFTTAGFDRTSVCFEEYQYAKAVAAGTVKDDTYLPMIYECQEDADWKDENVWKLANPGLGTSPKLEFLQEECRRASESVAYQNTFRRLYLNQWTEQDTRWLDIEKWDVCGEYRFDPAELHGRVGYMALDLSSRVDISAQCICFPPVDSGLWLFIWRFWIPAENIHKRSVRDRVPYDGWRRAGIIEATTGDTIDYDWIRARVLEDCEAYDIREIVYDRWGATQLITQLQADGLLCVPFGQGFASMSAPTKEFERLVIGRMLAHNNNDVMRWMVGNVAVRQDPAGNLKPDKAKSREKIDGVVAAIMALGRAMVNDATGSYYDKPDPGDIFNMGGA